MAWESGAVTVTETLTIAGSPLFVVSPIIKPILWQVNTLGKNEGRLLRQAWIGWTSNFEYN
jgi:hypothetical protein